MTFYGDCFLICLIACVRVCGRLSSLIGASRANVGIALRNGHPARHIALPAADAARDGLQRRVPATARLTAMPAEAPVVRVQPSHGLDALSISATAHGMTPVAFCPGLNGDISGSP